MPQKQRCQIKGSEDVEVSGLFLDSRKVVANGLFAAIKGSQVDGHDYIEMAIRNGATSILLEEMPENPNEKITWIKTDSARNALAEMADKFFDRPSSNINVIAITGTNGKTSVAWMMYRVLNLLGEKCGLISTIDIRFGDEVVPAKLTTPDVVSVHRIMSQMVDANCEYVVMEASSHALDQGRMKEVDVDAAIFTNISRDHLDYHGDMLSYIKCKKILFDDLKSSSRAIINKDDRNGEVMVQSSKSVVKTYSLRQIADYRLKLCSMDLNGMELEWNGIRFYTQITGGFNAYNIGAVLSTLCELEFEYEDVLTALSQVDPPEGRLDLVRDGNGRVRAIVDYAHTPDALVSVLRTINELKKRNQKLILVVGAGGNRDKGKRPMMAKAAVVGADTVIFTADNPRDEEADDIIDDMLDGLSSVEQDDVLVVPNRKKAIQLAGRLSGDQDVIVIVGKGHEKYQEIKGEKFPFDDKVEVYNYLYKETKE